MKQGESKLREKEVESKLLLGEMQIKKCEEEYEISKINWKAQMLLKCKELLDKGISKEDVDKVLPLP
jgi:hypothetical protein